jgi:hypothetical protein
MTTANATRRAHRDRTLAAIDSVASDEDFTDVFAADLWNDAARQWKDDDRLGAIRSDERANDLRPADCPSK